MKSTLPEESFATDLWPESSQSKKIHEADNNESRPVLRSSSNLQVQDSAASQLSTNRASSENTISRSSLNDDRISHQSGSQENGQSIPPISTAAWQSKYILTLDGGGIRGYSALLIIRELMKICASLEQRDNPQASSSYHPHPFVLSQGTTLIPNDRQRSAKYLPVHYFDYIAGTSTGGLIAIMLSRLRMNIDDCIAEYTELGKRIFGNRLRFFHTQRRIFSLRGPIPWNREKHDHEELEKVIQAVVDKRLNVSKDRAAGQMFPSHESRCRTMVVAVKENSASLAPYIFRSYNHEHRGKFDVRNPGPADNVRIVDVARATTAAPTYFKPKVINDQKYLDGGFCTNANNPSQIAHSEVLLMHGNNTQAVALLISIGTGKLKNSTPFPNTNSMFGKYRATINHAIHAASDAEKTHQNMLQHMASIKTPYERFNVDGGLDRVKLGDWKTVSQRSSVAPVNVTLKTIEDATNAYLSQKDVRRKLEKMALMLVKNRQERSKTPQWECAATGSRYHCNVDFCLESWTPYFSEEHLREHLVKTHAHLGYRYPAVTEADKTLLERAISEGKISHGD